MTNIKTKTDLLHAMSAYYACDGATKYVLAAPETATAREIWTGCADGEWLVWFGVRHRPEALRSFAYGCADRAVRVYAADALARAGLGGEATKLRALAPIVDADTARVGAAAADVTYDITAAAARAAEAAIYAARATADAVLAARATRTAVCVIAYAATAAAAARDAATSYAAVAAVSAASRANAAGYTTERHAQLGALHALADAVLVGP